MRCILVPRDPHRPGARCILVPRDPDQPEARCVLVPRDPDQPGSRCISFLHDLAALPADTHERTVTEGILVQLQRALGKRSSRIPKEEELIVSMQSTWEKARTESLPRHSPKCSTS